MTARTQTATVQNRPLRGTFGASFKAGLLGGLGIGMLLIVYQISPNSLLRWGLVPPALLLVWTVTGIGAAMFCDNRLKTSRDGGRVGLVAGLVAGTIGGLFAMVIAALGASFVGYGYGFSEQLSDSQMQLLLNAGFTEELIVLTGSIFSSMFACGMGGMAVAALLGWFGGWLYPKFNR